MPLLEVLRLAFEALMANRLRAGLTMLGMIIGVGAVVLLVSIGNGAKNYITSEFEGLGTNLIMVQPGRTSKGGGMGPPISNIKKKLTLTDVEAIQKRAVTVADVTGIIIGNASIEFEGQSTSNSVLGTNERFKDIFNVEMAQGNYFSREDEESGRRVIVLGANVAKSLFPDGSALGRLVKVNNSEHRVVGLLKTAGNKLGFNMDEFAFIPTRTSMKLFNDDKLIGLRARARSKDNIKDAVAEIAQILKERRNGDEDFTIVTQESMLETMNTILGMLTYALGGIAMISMLVGGIGIMNIMLVSVTERTREIGVRRAVGARQIDILKQFIAEALALSLLGGAIGLGGSVFITFAVSVFLPSFNMRAPLWILAPAFILSTLTGLVFGVWPARKASKIETIDALRFE